MKDEEDIKKEKNIRPKDDEFGFEPDEIEEEDEEVYDDDTL